MHSTIATIRSQVIVGRGKLGLRCPISSILGHCHTANGQQLTVDVHLGLTLVVLEVTLGLLGLVAGHGTNDSVFLAFNAVTETVVSATLTGEGEAGIRILLTPRRSPLPRQP